MGAFAGAALSNVPDLAILDAKVFGKTVLFIVLAPTIGMTIGMLLFRLVRSAFGDWRPGKVDRVFRRGQLVSGWGELA